jgi:hypothetical protein
LERWTGAEQAPTPPASTNQYLYSGFEPPAELQVMAVRRVWLVVAAGLCALGIGLVWLRTRVGRSTIFCAVVCVAAATLLLSYPEAAVLLVQAAAIGVAFTALSALIEWLMADTQQTRPAPTTAVGSSVASLAATQPWVSEHPASGSQVSTPSLQSSGSAP